MLEAAAALAEHVQEDVALEGKKAPEPAGLAHHLLDVLRRLRSVPGRILAGIGDDVRRAVDLELPNRQRAGDDGRVDERVEVRRAIVIGLSSWSRLQSGDRRRPRRRQLEADLVRARRAVGQGDEGRAAVDDTEVGVHPVGRDRPSLAEQPIGQQDRGRSVGGDAPPVRRGPGHIERCALRRLRHQRLHARGVVLDAIEPRRPRRHHQIERRAR